MGAEWVRPTEVPRYSMGAEWVQFGKPTQGRQIGYQGKAARGAAAPSHKQGGSGGAPDLPSAIEFVWVTTAACWSGL